MVIGLSVCTLVVVVFVVWRLANRPIATGDEVGERVAPSQTTVTHAEPMGRDRTEPGTATSAPRSALKATATPVLPSGEPARTLGSREEQAKEENEPLTYEEELKAHYRRIRETAEYRAIDARMDQLRNEYHEHLKTPELDEQWLEHERNPFSAFGLTFEEGLDVEWSQEDWDYMRSVGEQIKQQVETARSRRIENQLERDRLYQQLLDLLNMTEAEFLIALGRPPRPNRDNPFGYPPEVQDLLQNLPHDGR